MVSEEKIVHFANFNITFGKHNEPMLMHFEDIIYPALLSGHKRGKPNELPQFYFSDVMIKKVGDRLCLVGNYIKETEYEIYTTMQNGELVSNPSVVPTAPYSRFIIFLDNHRMILVRNESKSPDVRSFQSTLREIVNHFIRSENRSRDEKNRLPRANINIVDIPLPGEIEAVLHGVKKINWLQMRFFPLNNDFNPNPVAESIRGEMKKLGSNSSRVRFTSPQSLQNTIDLIDQSAGLAVATLEVTEANGNKTKIKENQFSASTKIMVGRDIIEDDDEYLVGQIKQEQVISRVSEENRNLFNTVKESILRLKG